MRLILADGAVRDVRVGEALTGLCVARAEITSTDVLHPQFREWFDQVVLQRFAPLDEGIAS